MLISRKILFADPDKVKVKVSPFAQYISYLAPHQRSLNLWMAPLNQLEAAVPLTSSNHSLQDYWWLPDEKGLIYTQDDVGRENWQLYYYSLSTGESRRYTDPQCQVRLLQIRNATQILIALNERDKRYHDVYQVNLLTGDKTLLFKNEEYWDIIVDSQGECRIGIKINALSGEYIDLKTGEKIADLTLHDIYNLNFYPQLKPVFSKDNNTLYMLQTSTHNTSTLIAKEINTKSETVIAHHPQADLCDVLYHPQTKIPLAFAINDDKKQWFGLHDTLSAHIEKLSCENTGEMDIISQMGEGEHWVVSFSHSDGPKEYFQWKDQQLHFLFLSHEGMTKYTFNPMQSVNITMRDGIVCRSYLTLPRGAVLPVPLVLVVHGGPNYRDFWGFNVFHQWLSNRGYAVLSVNYRGSTGFGRAHSEAGNGEWAGKIREDLLEAVAWAVKEGITTSESVAILGRSFGGYQALVGLTFTPEFYRCGVDVVGPANLETMMKCFPPYWEPMRKSLNNIVGGDPNTEEGRMFLKENSPLTYVDKITRPLLMGHGNNDPQIMRKGSDQMVEAMRKNKVPVTYAIFSDEGHQLSHPANREAFYGLVEAFLAKNLGMSNVEPVKELPPTMQVEDDFNLLEEGKRCGVIRERAG